MVDFGSPEKTAAYTGARPEIVSRVGRGNGPVLDVGCSTGAIGAAVRDMWGRRVVGVELSADSASVAQEVLDAVIVGSVDNWDVEVAPSLAGELFDCVICADVLEHTVDPWVGLARIVESLRPGGRLILSLPNVGHHNTLTNVFMRRRFPRRDRGLHDVTHLRWFGRRDVLELVDHSGLRLVEMERVMRIFERPHRANAVAKYVPWGLRDLFTFQFVVVAVKE